MKYFGTLTAGLLMLATGPLLGSGFGLFEQGIKGVGNAGAYLVRAEDASALFHNPAGLSQLLTSEILISARPLTGKGFYSNTGQSTWDTETLFDAVPNFIVNFKLDRVAIAFGSVSSYHYDSTWDESDFPARFLGNRSEFTGMEHMAGISYKFNRNLSAGLGFRFLQADSTESRVLARPLDPNDPSLSYEVEDSFDVDGDGFGFNFGLRYYIPRRWGIGLAYWSAIDIDLDGDRSYSLFNRENDQRAINLFDQEFSNAPVSSNIELPARAGVGFVSRVTVRTRLEINAYWEQWSSVDQAVYETLDTQGNPEAVNSPRDWEDAFSLRIAGDFQQRRAILWHAAMGFSEGVVPDSSVNPYFPDNDRFMYSFGVSYTLRRRYILEASWLFTQNRDRPSVDQEFFFAPDAPDFLRTNGQEGLYENQRHQFSLGVRIRLGKIPTVRERAQDR